MLKRDLISKCLVFLSLLFISSFSVSAYAKTILKFTGTEAEVEQILQIEALAEKERKTALEAIFLRGTMEPPNMRFNAAKMLADIGDGNSKEIILKQLPIESDEITKEEEIRAMYMIDFRLAALSGTPQPESILLGYFSLDYYPLKGGIRKPGSFDNTVYFLYLLAEMRQEAIRPIIENILNLSKTYDLGLLPDACQDILYRLNTLKSYSEPRYIGILRGADLPLRYWAVSKLAQKPKTQVLTPDGKKVVDILKEQLTYAEWNGYEFHLSYIKNILTQKFGETIEEVSPFTYENQPPTIQSIANQTVYIGGTLNLTLSAQDPDGALPAIIYFKSLNTLPQGASITGNKLIWSPSSNQTGTYEITLYAEDEAGEMSNPVTFKIYVQGGGGYYGGGYYGGYY